MVRSGFLYIFSEQFYRWQAFCAVIAFVWYEEGHICIAVLLYTQCLMCGLCGFSCCIILWECFLFAVVALALNQSYSAVHSVCIMDTAHKHEPEPLHSDASFSVGATVLVLYGWTEKQDFQVNVWPTASPQQTVCGSLSPVALYQLGPITVILTRFVSVYRLVDVIGQCRDQRWVELLKYLLKYE